MAMHVVRRGLTSAGFVFVVWLSGLAFLSPVFSLTFYLSFLSPSLLMCHRDSVRVLVLMFFSNGGSLKVEPKPTYRTLC
jgi:hypothetical protein